MHKLIRVLLVDDHPAMRQGTQTILESSPRIMVVGTTGEGRRVLGLVADLQPDVVVLDIRLPDVSGVEVARQLRTIYPVVAVVILTGYEDPMYARALLELGVRGYVGKSASGDVLIAAVEAVAMGKTMILSDALNGPLHAGMEQLTQRERDVVRLLALGHRNAEIAEQLMVSLRTVEFHVSNILAKLQARSRTEAIRVARQWGLVGDEQGGGV